MAQNISYVGQNAAQFIANKVKSLISSLTFANIGGTATAAQIPGISTDKLTSGTLGLNRGGTGGTDAASARSSLNVYSKSEVDSRAKQEIFYGTCDTAASTAAKVVVCSDFTEDSDFTGCILNVKFANANTVSSPTLNVNNTGAINIKSVGTTNDAAYGWVAGEVVQFVFDGTYWMLLEGGTATTTYYGVTKLSDSYSSTSSTVAATSYAVYNGYKQREKKYTKTTMTLSASTWTKNSTTGFYEYSLTGSYATSTYDLVVDLNWDSATKDQASDWMNCQIVGSHGTNKLVARGGQPSQSYPIVLYVTNRSN